ncbi:U3 snoRNP protein [Chytridiales sp. JEL 0842]|nr:U3 snoRNP protein [Chytridiales sp. JEL 0842]
MKTSKNEKLDEKKIRQIYGNGPLNVMMDAKNPALVKKRKRSDKKDVKESKKVAAKKLEAVKDQGVADDLEEDFTLEKDDEEKELEDLLFGTDVDGSSRLESVLRNANIAVSSDDIQGGNGLVGASGDNDFELPDGEELFVIDKRKPRMLNPIGDEHGFDADETADNQDAEDGSNSTPAPLWEDNDTEGTVVNIAEGAQRLRKLREAESEVNISIKEFEQRLRRQYEKLHPTPAWAVAGSQSQSTASLAKKLFGKDSALSSVLRSSRSLIEKSTGRHLPSDSLEIYRVKDGNQMSPSAAVVQSCKFHPSAPVLLTAGLDKTLRLFHVDGKVNPKLQSVHFDDMPIQAADFTADGRQIVISGRRKFFYVFDVEAGTAQKVLGIQGRDEKSFEKHTASPCGRFLAFLGRDGYIILVSRHSKQWIANLRMNGSVRAIEFSKDGRFLFSVGSDGEIYQWDLSSRQCLHKFFDEGAMKVSTISVSPDNSYIATGSSAGIVNVYSSSSALKTDRPTPIKALMNLTTPITTLQFHPSSQGLLFASKFKKDALRVAHCPSLGVFPNWPTSGTPLSYVNSVDWSPGGGYLAMGNDKGKVLLYRLSTYEAC